MSVGLAFSLFSGSAFWHRSRVDDVGISFPPTPWSLILRIQKGSLGDRRRALETLCRSYWQPLYVYARLSGWGREDAEDLTQIFFDSLHTGESGSSCLRYSRRPHAVELLHASDGGVRVGKRGVRADDSC